MYMHIIYLGSKKKRRDLCSLDTLGNYFSCGFILRTSLQF